MRHTYVAPRPTPNPRPVDQATALQVAELLDAIAAGLRAGTLNEAAVRTTASHAGGGRGPVVRVAVTVTEELLDQANLSTAGSSTALPATVLDLSSWDQHVHPRRQGRTAVPSVVSP